MSECECALREQTPSLIYDWFARHALFDCVAQVPEKHCAVDPRDLQGACRLLFRRPLPDVSGWFPEGTAYTFSDKPQPENGDALVDTCQEPVGG